MSDREDGMVDVSISYGTELRIELTHEQYQTVRPALQYLEKESRDKNKIIAEQAHTIAEQELYIQWLNASYRIQRIEKPVGKK
jgi:hypothetical protein